MDGIMSADPQGHFVSSGQELVEAVTRADGRARGARSRPLAAEGSTCEPSLRERPLRRNGEQPAAPRKADAHRKVDSRLLSRMSHELRSPLNAVIGFSDLMHKEIHGPIGNDRYREYASHILTSGHELLRSAEDALAIAAMVVARTENTRECIEIGPVVLDVRRQLNPANAQRIVLDLDAEDSLAVVSQRRGLRQVIWNLVKEACRQSADTSVVRIGAVVEGEQVAIEIATEPRSQTVEEGERSLPLSIADSLVAMLGGSLVIDHATPGWRATLRLEAESGQGQLVLPMP